ncbi:prepilin peptidase [Arcobacter arenosus]|jgi:Flp pilus assembly protein protease CpaA|uniref:prepilin peptidase n=1 Tax=Arcobacter arenosus TaxID=2576037 RepID=UPI003BA89746
MIFYISFYIFSILLSYTDCTKYKIPNITILTLIIFLIIFGLLENKLNLYSIAISFAILIFFVIILIAMPKAILGGGDIKYIMVVALFLEPMLFPLFLIISGICQTLFLLYFQKIKKRRVAPMAPAIFLAVMISQLIDLMGLYMR